MKATMLVSTLVLALATNASAKRAEVQGPSLEIQGYYVYWGEDCMAPRRPFVQGMDVQNSDDFAPMVLRVYDPALGMKLDVEANDDDNVMDYYLPAGSDNDDELTKEAVEWYSFTGNSLGGTNSYTLCLDIFSTFK